MRDDWSPLPGLGGHITEVTDGDVEAVARLAAQVWWHHYPGIITAAQIEYMLKQRYEPALLRAELRRKDLWWDKLVAGDEIVAFSSYFLMEEGRAIKLDKLYVQAWHQRKGYGGRLIERVCECGRAQRCSRVTLAVNKNNATAIAAYKKHGFRIADAVVKEIGGGFVMDDFIMVKPLAFTG